MTTSMNLRMRRTRTIRLVRYKTEDDASVKINADVAFVYYNEEGYAAKCAKKERTDLGEHMVSVRLIGEKGDLEVRLYGGLSEGKISSDFRKKFFGRKVRETDDSICRLKRVSLENLMEIARYCKQGQLDIADAQQYFEDELFSSDRWNQYAIDEEKNRVVDIHYPRRFRS